MPSKFQNRLAKSVSVRLRKHVIVPLRSWKTARAARRQWSQATPEDYAKVQQRTLVFVDSLHVPCEGRGAYAYKAGGAPLLYASCYAAFTKHLCGKLQPLSETEKREWADYIKGFQGSDGLFRDPRIACELAETGDWWGWRHLTLHALMALSALGAKPQYRFQLLDQFQAEGSVSRWLEQRNWAKDTAGVSNEVQNIGTLMQYSRDYLGEHEWTERLEELYQGLDARQDVATGLWGPGFDSPLELSLGVQSAYHFWMLYFYDRRKVHYASAALASCLRSQTKSGGFGAQANTSACEDIDSVDPIARFTCRGHAHENSLGEVRSAAERALWWNLGNQNPDGGWVFRRHAPFLYGHALMGSAADESAMFPSWFRLLSTALLARLLPEHPVATLPWHFLECPGHQFWLGRSTPDEAKSPA